MHTHTHTHTHSFVPPAHAGKPDLAYDCAKILYDPKYGDPATPGEMGDEHRRCIEDEILFQLGDEINALTQVIATLV